MKLPEYITFGEGGCAMRLDTVLNRYWRDAGLWGVEFKEVDGKIMSCNHPFDNLNNVELIPTTEDFWREDNGAYLPSDDQYHKRVI